MGLNNLGSILTKAGSTLKDSAIRSAQAIKLEQQITTLKREIPCH